MYTYTNITIDIAVINISAVIFNDFSIWMFRKKESSQI